MLASRLMAYRIPDHEVWQRVNLVGLLSLNWGD